MILQVLLPLALFAFGMFVILRDNVDALIGATLGDGAVDAAIALAHHNANVAYTINTWGGFP